MAINKCENGHYYDSEKYDICPHCGKKDVATPASGDVVVESKQERIALGGSRPDSGEEKTIGLFVKSKGADPVVGWLVCVAGKERGRDYRIFSGRNFVGRSAKMQIYIPDDPEVSRENHCSIVYEPIKKEFLIAPGTGTGTFLNGERLDSAKKLKNGDKIEIGGITLDFVPYCGEGRNWN